MIRWKLQLKWLDSHKPVSGKPGAVHGDPELAVDYLGVWTDHVFPRGSDRAVVMKMKVEMSA